MAQKNIYYDGLERMAGILCHTAEKLKGVYSSSLPAQKEFDAVKKDTAALSGIKKAAAKKLERDFLPPMDREDITLIMQAAEDYAFSLKDCIVCIIVTGAAANKKEAAQMAAGIYESTRLLYIALASLKDGMTKASADIFGNIAKICRGISDEHDEAIKKLFSAHGDAHRTAAWIKIFDSLRRAAFRCKKAADVLEYAILKNS